MLGFWGGRVYFVWFGCWLFSLFCLCMVIFIIVMWMKLGFLCIFCWCGLGMGYLEGVGLICCCCDVFDVEDGFIDG